MTDLTRKEVERYAALNEVWPPKVHQLAQALTAAWDALEEMADDETLSSRCRSTARNALPGKE